MSRVFTLAVALCALGWAPARASIINAPDVFIAGNPYRAFIDGNTGRTWLDLDNFWDASATYNSLTELLSGSGYHLATLADLVALQASIPVAPANYAAEVLIAGGNYRGNSHPGWDRDLMWGIYEDANSGDGISWAWKHRYDTSWNSAANQTTAGVPLFQINSGHQDLGAWVVADRVLSVRALPEPISLLVWAGAAMMGGATVEAGRRRQEDATVADHGDS